MCNVIPDLVCEGRCSSRKKSLRDDVSDLLRSLFTKSGLFTLGRNQTHNVCFEIFSGTMAHADMHSEPGSSLKPWNIYICSIMTPITQLPNAPSPQTSQIVMMRYLSFSKYFQCFFSTSSFNQEVNLCCLLSAFPLLFSSCNADTSGKERSLGRRGHPFPAILDFGSRIAQQYGIDAKCCQATPSR